MKDHKQDVRVLSLGIGLFIVLLFSALAVHAEVYKVVDEEGNVTYTDKAPSPDAVPVKLRGLSVISPQTPSPSSADRKSAGAPGDPDEAVTSIRKLKDGYRDFSIVSPAPDQTFWGTDNIVTVAWNTRYALQPGMKVRIYVDGEAREETADTMVKVDKVWRGTHEVHAELVDARNRIIATTGKVSFHIKQYSTQFTARRNQGGG